MAQQNVGGTGVIRGQDDYPVQLSIEYPESSNRLTALVRIILAIPILIVATFVSGAFTTGDSAADQIVVPIVAGGALWIAPLLMILFRQKYPRWWFDWNLELSRFSTRVGAYLLLLRDEYPSTDERQAVTLDIDYPDAENDLNRFLPLVKWLLAIPHLIILAVLANRDHAPYHHRVVRDPDRGPVSTRNVRVRGRGVSLGDKSGGLRLPAHHRQVSAVPSRPVSHLE